MSRRIFRNTPYTIVHFLSAVQTATVYETVRDKYREMIARSVFAERPNRAEQTKRIGRRGPTPLQQQAVRPNDRLACGERLL